VNISDRTRRALQDFGLTDYEMKAYTSLLEYGVMTASQISASSKVPYSKIYEVLGSLERKGWVESNSGRPSKYYPKPPVEALEITKLRLESAMKDNERLIISELQPLYEKKEVHERPDIWIVRGESNILAKIRETLNRSQKELLIATPVLPESLARMLNPILTHLKGQGVKIMVMTAKAASHNILKTLTNVDEVRVRDQMFGGGLISDGKEVILLLSEEEKPTLAVWSIHVGLAKIAQTYFEYLWKNAKSLSLGDIKTSA
jgi:sugar-specific transcriptional regulator TrmB